jgi:hypothetical protein
LNAESAAKTYQVDFAERLRAAANVMNCFPQVGFVSDPSNMLHCNIEFICRTQPLLHNAREQRACEPRPRLPSRCVEGRACDLGARDSSYLDVKLWSHAS